MQSVRSILVVIDPAHTDSLALNRAKLIAGVTQAHLHLLICDKDHPHTQWTGPYKTGHRYPVNLMPFSCA